MKFLISLLTLTTLLTAEITLPKNFKTDFTQSITNEKGKVIKYEGRVFFMNFDQMLSKNDTYNSSLFKWLYTAPTKKEVCTDGVQIIVVDHDLEQVSSYIIEEGVNLHEILKIATKISETSYTATYKEVEYKITLDEKGQLSEISYLDSLENAVKINFNNMAYETSLNEEALVCTAPQDYDVIKG